MKRLFSLTSEPAAFARSFSESDSASILEDPRKTVAAAISLANSLARAKIIVFTHHGTMARYVSNLRPERAPIFAVASNENGLSSARDLLGNVSDPDRFYGRS